MMIRTLAASAAVLVFATGGAFAQPAPSGDFTCASLNAMGQAEQLAFAKDYIEAQKAGGGMPAARTTEPQAGAGPNQAGEPGKASGGPGDAAANADPAQKPADDLAVAPENGQPALPGAEDNRNEELDQAANADPAKPAGNAAPAGDMAAANQPAGVSADDAVKSFDGIDAAGLVAACVAAPDKTFGEVMPIIPAAGQ